MPKQSREKTMPDIKFPTDHEYLCGYGKRFDLDSDNRISIFEDDSHNCIDIKGFINGKHFWKQFFYWDYEPDDFFILEEQGDHSYDWVRKKCQKDAENKFLNLVEEMRRIYAKNTEQ